jgi:ribosomal protein L32
MKKLTRKQAIDLFLEDFDTVTCKKCGAIHLSNYVCARCGHDHSYDTKVKKSVRKTK